MTDISRLQVQLQVTKLQNKDNPLYQLLHELIGALKDTANEVTSLSGSSGGSITNNITNNNFSLASGIGSSGNGLSATSHPMLSVVNKISPVANNIIQSRIDSGSVGLSAISLSFLSQASQSVGGGITGSGTIGKIPKWTGASVLGDSIISEAASLITITGNISLISGAVRSARADGDLYLQVVANGDTTYIGGTPADSSLSISLTNGILTVPGTLAWGGGAAIASSGNVALLSAANVFTGVPQTIFGSQLKLQTDSVFIGFYNTAGTRRGYLQNVEGGTFTLAQEQAFGLAFQTNALVRFGINAAGDWLQGSSIMDSVGVPIIASGYTGATISGKDFSFYILIGGTPSTGGVITFGHAWDLSPVCVASSNNSAAYPITLIPSTTGLTISHPSVSLTTIFVHCRGRI